LSNFPRILAIDPGASCGYAYIDIPQPLPKALKAQVETAGLWDLSNKRFEDDGMRYLRLEKHLVDVNPDMIMFEQVKFRHKSRQAEAVYHSIVNTIQMFCKKNNIACTGVDTSAVKTRAVGKGGGKGTKKPNITDAANAFFGTDFSLSEKQGNTDHNIADAMWILQCGIEEWGPVLRPREQWPTSTDSTYFPSEVGMRVEGKHLIIFDCEFDNNSEEAAGELCRFASDGDVNMDTKLAFAQQLVKLVNGKKKRSKK